MYVKCLQVILNEEQKLYFCGYQPPPALVSTGQTMGIEFKFEYDRDIPLTGRGFNATFTQVSREYQS